MLRLLAAVLALTLPAAAQTAQTPAAAQPYTSLYVFGDSYSDSGSGYVDSNGPTAVVYLAQHLNIPFTYYGDPLSPGKSLNFAVSAARSGEQPGHRFPTGQIFAFGVQNQVDNFLAAAKSHFLPPIDPAQTMFFFLSGLNDGGEPDGYTRTNIEAEIDSLYSIGARRFMVALLPTKIPNFASAAAKANPQLAAIPAEERQKHPDIRIANSNWGPFFDTILASPAKYGFTNTTDKCADRSFTATPAPTCATPDTYFYFHDAHPSTAAHRVVGEMLYQEALHQAP